MNAMKYMLLALVAMLVSCSRSTADYAEEDYDTLFPFTGVEKPKISYEDQVVQLGNPDAPVSDFVYPGVEITKDVRTYDVTLTCSFREVDILGNNVPEAELASRYVVRYVAANRSLTTIATNKTNEDATSFLSNGQQHELHFKAKSGFPMYLLVNGVGPRGSSIKATISAISEDGLTIVKPLKVNEHQNEEGIGKIKGPFCAYIILP